MFSFLWNKQLTRVTPSEAIDQIAKEHIAPLLKNKGFKKSGRTWLMEFEDYSFVINIQASKWNGRETGASFTVNYGVYIPSIYEPLYSMQKPKSPKHYDCILSRRVQHEKKEEIWWTIYDNTNPAKLGDEVKARILEQCISWFKTINSLSNIIDTRQTYTDKSSPWNNLVDALLFAELGNQQSAQHAFSLAYRHSEGNDPFQAKVISVAKKYKISF